MSLPSSDILLALEKHEALQEIEGEKTKAQCHGAAAAGPRAERRVKGIDRSLGQSGRP